MITNIVETIQKNLGYPSLQKIDPNSQEVKHIAGTSPTEKLGQAAITAVLAGLINYSRSESGSTYLFSHAGEGQNWLEKFFGTRKQEAVDKVAHYSGTSSTDAAGQMQAVANEAVRVIHESAGIKETPERIRTFLNGQRHNILLYLPAAMQFGDLLKDDSLDDRTHKMEGPISNFIHSIEKKF
ncbi:MAG: hypothetical protein EOO01_22450 [Chitinophagaceae bacterium]|nr:MAG: hypothetical protein EOO01_22450 [Chitinophagaceae bacterium]